HWRRPLITIGGRYGLSSKEFGPACVLAVFNELSRAKPKPRFTVGIYDDVTNLSLPLPENTLPGSAKLEALFYGLGSDGSVSATKNNIKIIGNSTPWYAQGYFVYDSKKAGGLTVSHLRVSEKPIRSAYLIAQADFVGCHQLQFIDKYQMAERLKPGGIFLLNTPYSADEVWSRLPQEVQAVLNQKKARFYVVNAAKIARECGLGARINTVMQMAFFHLTHILPGDSALVELQGAIAKSYSSKGQDLVERNWQALALAQASLAEVPLQAVNPHSAHRPPVVSDAAPDFVKTVTAAMLAGKTVTAAMLPCWRASATHCLFPPCRRTEHGRWAPPAGKNAISPKRFLSGKRSCVHNVITASPPALTRRFVRKSFPRRRWRTRQPVCIRWT
ncbi:Pyruvate-flavodoxin oxidoreductase, partial [Salmonella enterica subsp. enterica serovar Urbana str. R8-2977]